MSGYWGYPDCKTCSSCVHGQCDSNNGSCICNPNFAGSKCDGCDVSWSGDNCDTAIEPKINEYIKYGIIAIVVLVVIAVAAGVLWYFKYKNFGEINSSNCWQMALGKMNKKGRR